MPERLKRLLNHLGGRTVIDYFATLHSARLGKEKRHSRMELF
jgi:hypothetical protein